jgi:UDP-2,3-diacylglucosamine pyrophosphatase LpxH
LTNKKLPGLAGSFLLRTQVVYNEGENTMSGQYIVCWEAHMQTPEFIAKMLCRLGRDRYTKEGTREALKNAYENANERTFDARRDKWILFSDHHRGAKNHADDFHPCEAIYCAALAYYYELGYSLCVMGDSEEFWEERPERVLKNTNASFDTERQFHEADRYARLWGNHDELWSEPEQVREKLQPKYGNKPIEVQEAIRFEVNDGEQKLGRILLLHGHQGTQNAIDRNASGRSQWAIGFSKFVLRNIWRPIQQILRFSCNTPASSWDLRDDRDKILHEWACTTPGLILIAGHTHAPVFTSRSHRLRLLEDIDNMRKDLKKIQESERNQKRKELAQFAAELELLEHKMSADELKAWTQEKEDWITKKLKPPKPGYFNTGCCSFADEKITGIEIADGEMRLVRFPNDDDKPYPKTLQSKSLVEIFEELQNRS